MYDTIHFYLPQEQCSDNLLLTIPNKLSHVKETRYEDGNVSLSGSLKGLQFRVTNTRLKLTGGSIPKFYIGDNIGTLSRGDAQRCIECMSDLLSVDLSNAKMTRLDFATNILTKHPEGLYYPYLGESLHYQRREQPNGIYYNNHQKNLVFYSKVDEQKDKGNFIPVWARNLHLLRYEMRLTQRVHKQMKEEVNLSKIYNEDFYVKMIDRWYSEYTKIQKQNMILNELEPTGSTKELDAQALAFVISTVGINRFNLMLDEWHAKREISRKAKSDLKKRARDVISKYEGRNKNELITELDRKVKESIYSYR